MNTAVRGKIMNWLREGFRPEFLLPGLVTGLLVGFTEVLDDISFGSLVFSGELAGFLSIGFTIALVTSTVVMVVTALASSIPGTVGGTQDSPSVLLGVIATSLAAALGATRAEAMLATILAAISLATLLTGLFMFLLGLFRQGRLVRFIPYPVMGGFLAGTGWLLIRASIGVMGGTALTLANLPLLIQPARLVAWVPGVLLALVLLVCMHRFKHPLVMPGILVGAILLFYLVLLLAGISLKQAAAQGLVMGSFSGVTSSHTLALQNLWRADWRLVLGQGGNIVAVLIVAVVGLLLNASGLELVLGRDIDLNRELRTTGIANLLSGLGGGMIGFDVLYQTALGHRMSARTRLTGLVAGLICGVMLFAGPALLAVFPRPVAGALAFLLGLELLIEWVFTGWKKLSTGDYAVVLLILVVIAATNFLVGVGVGLVAAVVLFVVNYSRINVVHHAASGAELRSKVERSLSHERILSGETGAQVRIFELQGYLFFGTANSLLEQIQACLAEPRSLPLRYILLDFRRVSGLDSSAGLVFHKARQLAQAHNVTLVLTQLPDPAQRVFRQAGFFGQEDGSLHFPDLDRGLEWCEERLLESGRLTAMQVPSNLLEQLAERGFSQVEAQHLLQFLEQVEFQADEYLMHQGEEPTRMYFIEKGTVTVFLELDGRSRVRLQSQSMGTSVGERGLYTLTRRNASVIADTPVTAYCLTRDMLTLMKAREPALAASLHEFVARLLAGRLAAATQSLEAVLK